MSEQSEQNDEFLAELTSEISTNNTKFDVFEQSEKLPENTVEAWLDDTSTETTSEEKANVSSIQSMLPEIKDAIFGTNEEVIPELTDIKEVEVTSTLTREQLTECLAIATKTVASWKNVDPTRLKRQIATCLKVIDGILIGKKEFIVDAPTGFGKTLLGLMLIEMFKNASNKGYIKMNKNSYILTPNKFLQDQYQQDIDKFDLAATHVQLKGQGNYVCAEDTTLSFAKRPCAKIGVSKLPEKLKCAASCEYVQTRLKAMKSTTAVFNYSYYLTAMNYVFAALGDNAPFKPRGLTVVDECHVLEKTVQDMFETAYNFAHTAYEIESSFTIVNSLYGAGLMTKGSITDEDVQTVQKCQTALHALHDVLLKYAAQASKSPSTPIFENIMSALNGSAKVINAVVSIYSKTIALNFPQEEEDYSDNQVIIAKDFAKMQDLVTKTALLDELYKYAGIDSMVIDTADHFIGAKKLSKQQVTFRCVKSAHLIKRFFSKWTDYSVMMSATIGQTIKELNAFATSNGFENAYIISNESDFNFERSPIIMTVPLLSMSWNDKAKSMPQMLKRIDQIATYHNDVAGLVHTGNYEFMNALKRYVSTKPELERRFIFCDSAFMKTEAIARLERDIAEKGKTNMILAGPGLLEGIDLKDDKCRFNCFMKVPYASLADELVKRKNIVYPDWYNLNTMTQFMQGLGRPVRHKDDWGIAYLLDGSFSSFFNRYGELPKLVSTRLINADLTYRFDETNNINN